MGRACTAYQTGRKKIAFPIPYSDHDVATKVFPPIKWAIPGIAPEGAIILAGRPKMGKSWMILQWLMAIAVGGKVFGKIAVESGDALYLALEDSERRIQKRRNRVAESLHYGTLPSLYYVNEWPRMTELTRGSQTVLMPSNQAFDGLSYWLDAHPLARIIAVDTLAKFRPRSNGKNSYQADYDAMSQIQEFATKRQICIVVVTHTRKHRAGEDEDVLDEIQDTTGVTGAVDATCVLKRERYSNLAQLHITGRDVDERNIPLVWDKEKFLWLQNETEESDPAQVIPANRLVVLQAFELAGQEVMDIPSLAMACKKNYDAMAKHLERMVKEGLLKKAGQGAYKLSEQALSKMSKMSKST